MALLARFLRLTYKNLSLEAYLLPKVCALVLSFQKVFFLFFFFGVLLLFLFVCLFCFCFLSQVFFLSFMFSVPSFFHR